jgi:hypothetical protein
MKVDNMMRMEELDVIKKEAIIGRHKAKAYSDVASARKGIKSSDDLVDAMIDSKDMLLDADLDDGK